MTAKSKEAQIMSQEIQDKLLGFITRNFCVEKDDIDLETSLVDQGVIDSFGLIEICSFMEGKFSITVTEDLMNRNNFGSVLKMVNFIGRQINNENYF